MILRSRAPIRLDFAGGWTDVSPFRDKESGAVVNATITRYTYVTLVPRRDEAIRIISADFDTFIEVQNFKKLEYDGNLDLVKAAIRRLGLKIGMNLYVRCDAPPGSGTGSSASISVALIGLLNTLQDERLSPHEIAELAHRLEIEELHIAGGKQDQYASVLGGFSYLEFRNEAVSNSALRLPPRVVRELEKHLILCYTGKSRLSGDIIKRVMGSYERGEKKVTRALLRIREIAVEMKSALMTGNLGYFADLLDENWSRQKDLDPTVSNTQIDDLFKLAYKSGALGGKALGAGGGGCLLFYCKENKEHLVRRALETAGVQIIDFNFDFDGLQTWQVPEPIKK
ncbi:GHMP kinase [Candidatus Sumerlaeota bacterium]|nr:GHMP kinase [Candidatus Sumerlaeota bacterium]